MKSRDDSAAKKDNILIITVEKYYNVMDLNFRINFKVKLNSEKFAKQWRNRTQRLDLVKSSFKLLALDLSTNQSDPSKATKTFGKNQNRKEQSSDS